MSAPVRLRVDPEVQRRRIIGEAIGLIGQRGYHGFTIQSLAQRCGLTNGGLLYHFGSKEQLLVAMLQERDRREAEIIPAGLRLKKKTSRGFGYARADVLQVFGAITARTVEQPELLRLQIVLQAEALNHEHPAYDYFLQREGMVLDEFAKVLAGHTADPRSAARKILALMGGLEQQWIRSDQGFDLAAECGQAFKLVLPLPHAASITTKRLRQMIR
jgi:AcrR family transcriptional regulator